MPSLALLKRKEVWFPTWRGWLLILLVTAMLVIGATMGAVPFLAAVRPMHQGVLVVEGWIPDYAMEEAKRVFESHSYKFLVVTGVPIEQGYYISKEKNFARLAVLTLKELGMKEEAIVPIMVANAPRDRTYATARQVRVWLDAKSITDPVDVFTLGVHARRTWLLYRLALGNKYTSGVIASSDRSYDPHAWWKTSSGFRTVTSEIIAYVYAKLLFNPRNSESIERGSNLNGGSS
jgi:hypothetical protein